MAASRCYVSNSILKNNQKPAVNSIKPNKVKIEYVQYIKSNRKYINIYIYQSVTQVTTASFVKDSRHIRRSKTFTIV